MKTLYLSASGADTAHSPTPAQKQHAPQTPQNKNKAHQNHPKGRLRLFPNRSRFRLHILWCRFRKIAMLQVIKSRSVPLTGSLDP